MGFADPLSKRYDSTHEVLTSSPQKQKDKATTRIRVDSDAPSSVSLAANYIPTKFSGPPSVEGVRKRNQLGQQKAGGGREAFRSNEARMPSVNDEDYDGVDNIQVGLLQRSRRGPRWNKFKWTLFLVNIIVAAYSLTLLIICILTWLKVFHHADIVRVGNRPELIISTAAAALGVLTSLVGWAGILLNNRGFLAVYTFFLWIVFALSVAPGYMTYKKRTFNLEGKINAQWSRELGEYGRLRIQDQLQCCGYYSPFVEATVSQICYARSVLPGCKNAYLHFERDTLLKWYSVSFGLVPVQLLSILAALLCSNHITYRWGKGMTPKAYRLNVSSLALIADNYANQLAEEFSTCKGTSSSAMSTQWEQLSPSSTIRAKKH